MKCPECDFENPDGAKFCKSCGHQFKNSETTKPVSNGTKSNTPIIIVAIAIIIVLAGVGVFASGILDPGVPMVHKEFDYFELDVPEENNFKLATTNAVDDDHFLILYEDTSVPTKNVSSIMFGKNIDDDNDDEYQIESDGNMKVYQDGKYYGVFVEKDGYQLEISGKNDVDTMKKMGKSFELGDVDKLKEELNPQQQNNPKTTQTTSKQATQTTNSMSILGGTFSTGSSLSDKTKASIYVGSEHAGENVIIQIFYSRNGANLNNGNMVPKTVDSGGYINVNSADSFSSYPDFATINLYDSSSKLLDTQSVNLSPTGGTQTF